MASNRIRLVGRKTGSMNKSILIVDEGRVFGSGHRSSNTTIAYAVERSQTSILDFEISLF